MENETEKQTPVGSDALFCWFLGYNHPNGSGWSITKTHHDLDHSEGLQAFVKEMEQIKGHAIVPTYWKIMKQNRRASGTADARL